MKVVVQRVKGARVVVEGKTIGQIASGLLLYVGFKRGDVLEDIAPLVRKICNLRIFADDTGKMQLSIQDVQQELLVVSQFTLYADTTQGNRPSFTNAEEPKRAEKLYEAFLQEARNILTKENVFSGQFRAHMDVHSVNDGPVTILL